mmetsp:Transcript_49800/g.131629  ORF Transcript_49800/g.131629 Transcript_49800/m.131629 type:complete len:103 (+) Transcript_49800:142-450(+)
MCFALLATAASTLLATLLAPAATSSVAAQARALSLEAADSVRSDVTRYLSAGGPTEDLWCFVSCAVGFLICHLTIQIARGEAGDVARGAEGASKIRVPLLTL